MQAKKLAGPEAASQKYDLLTALGCHALGADRSTQRLVLRFVTLITARYNWRQGVLTVGQREIARLWAVDERTVKREMAKLRELGWLVLESPARRGRVAGYALDMIAIRAATRDAWIRVGSDFDTRMRGLPEPGGTVVPFPQRPETSPGEPATEAGIADDAWGQTRAILQAEDPAVFATWFDALKSPGRAGECLILVAPSAFHATYVRTHYSERLLRAQHLANGPRDFRVVVSIEGAPEVGRPDG